jgi:uncharacterized protein (TIGR02186 family)
MRRPAARGRRGATALAACLLLASLSAEVAAQRRQRGPPLPVPVPERPLPETKAGEPPAAAPAKSEPRETVQADVSTRRVAVTANFSGTEVVVFGAVDNSRQASAEAGLYDIVIVLVGTPSRLVARRKANVAGLWLNVQSLVFDSVPSYYAIASTRPLDEIASEDVLKAYDIGFEHVRMTLSSGTFSGPPTKEIKEFREAVVRIKQKERLYQQEQYGVAFIGRSLFRASIDLPANVTVGPVDTRVYLFRDGELLSQYTVRLNLEREGLEEILHGFALRHAALYGLAAVLMAVGAGLLASAFFRKGAH